jgi:hypothetical protein
MRCSVRQPANLPTFFLEACVKRVALYRVQITHLSSDRGWKGWKVGGARPPAAVGGVDMEVFAQQVFDWAGDIVLVVDLLRSCGLIGGEDPRFMRYVSRIRFGPDLMRVQVRAEIRGDLPARRQGENRKPACSLGPRGGEQASGSPRRGHHLSSVGRPGPAAERPQACAVSGRTTHAPASSAALQSTTRTVSDCDRSSLRASASIMRRSSAEHLKVNVSDRRIDPPFCVVLRGSVTAPTPS